MNAPPQESLGSLILNILLPEEVDIPCLKEAMMLSLIVGFAITHLEYRHFKISVERKNDFFLSTWLISFLQVLFLYMFLVVLVDDEQMLENPVTLGVLLLALQVFFAGMQYVVVKRMKRDSINLEEFIGYLIMSSSGNALHKDLDDIRQALKKLPGNSRISQNERVSIKNDYANSYFMVNALERMRYDLDTMIEFFKILEIYWANTHPNGDPPINISELLKEIRNKKNSFMEIKEELGQSGKIQKTFLETLSSMETTTFANPTDFELEIEKTLNLCNELKSLFESKVVWHTSEYNSNSEIDIRITDYNNLKKKLDSFPELGKNVLTSRSSSNSHIIDSPSNSRSKSPSRSRSNSLDGLKGFVTPSPSRSNSPSRSRSNSNSLVIDSQVTPITSRSNSHESIESSSPEDLVTPIPSPTRERIESSSLEGLDGFFTPIPSHTQESNGSSSFNFDGLFYG